MEINFFGLIDVTRKAMETMRDLKTGGVIQQVTSVGGQIGKFDVSVLHRFQYSCYFRRTHLLDLLRKQMGG